ncbi:MAG: (d)CMP kinase [Candidatus Delongbacteria bacterium]|nr:(d)CMP kinase [Candidatus Delongbacteria bacterium]
MRPIETYFATPLPCPITIAVDGPAASGKSTTAKGIADRLGLLYIDTGAMYRCLTWKTILNHLDCEDAASIIALLNQTEIELDYTEGVLTVRLDRNDVSEIIRSPQVSARVSEISAIPEVRSKMVEWQRRMAQARDSILDGRDIGTVVLPNATLKIFMICSLESRTERRMEELRRKGISISRAEVMADIEKRDRIDSSRATAPLKQADDAILVDTSQLSIPQQIDQVIQFLHHKVKTL